MLQPIQVTMSPEYGIYLVFKLSEEKFFHIACKGLNLQKLIEEANKKIKKDELELPRFGYGT